MLSLTCTIDCNCFALLIRLPQANNNMTPWKLARTKWALTLQSSIVQVNLFLWTYLLAPLWRWPSTWTTSHRQNVWPLQKRNAHTCTHVSNCTVFTESGQNLSFLQPSAKTTIYGRICINIFLKSRTCKKSTHTFAHNCKVWVKTLVYCTYIFSEINYTYGIIEIIFFVKKLCQIW